MDSKGSRKSSFRDRLKEKGKDKDKRIVSPLVRYNSSNQPVCKVCDVVLKNESFWNVHQVSRKHHEALSNFKASVALLNQGNNAKPESRKELPKPKHERSEELQSSTQLGHSREPTRPQLSSGLPPDFFDNKDSQKPDTKRNSLPVVEPDSSYKTRNSTQAQTEPLSSENENYRMPSGTFAEAETRKPARELTQTSQVEVTNSETTQVKGALPEGFFDNKEADLRARGIKPVKPDVKDEYKEFEKLIQEDLQEVDNRMEEEEIDAAEMIEEAETVEQKTYREKVELLRKKKMELKATRSAKRSRGSEGINKKPKHDESSSDDDGDENFTVDWRAQHL